MTVVDSEQARTALVLFGTETGTSQDLALETSRILERLHFITDVDELDNISAQALTQYTIVVFVIATTGQGDFPSNARRFWRTLLPKRLTSDFLSEVQYFLVGLGDSSYPKFNLAARKLHKRLKQLGASCLLQPCEADEQGEDSTDGAFISWSQLFRSKLVELFPLVGDQKPIPDNKPLISRWTLKEANVNGDMHHSAGSQLLHNTSSIPSLKSADVPFPVTLERNDRVTPADHWQDVRSLRLRANQAVHYYPGDALAIRSKNMSEDVDQLIDLMNWNDIADRAIHLQLNKEGVKIDRPPDSTLGPNRHLTLRQLLTNHLDIMAIPRRSFFASIANFTEDSMHKERLLEFTEAQYLDEYYDYATRPRRSILEILQEFDSVKIPWQDAINVFPVLRPRQFSIASGGLSKEGGFAFELLVAIVRYRTVIKRIREGICTRYLARLPVGSTLEVVLKTEGRFHRPDQLLSMNHLLVGAGTGIAPLRAVIQEKFRHGMETCLIFGCRNEGADYFFQHDWQDMGPNDTGSELSVVTAFSRDQRHKVYIQDRIRENAPLVLKHLFDANSTTIVCGSSGAMPKAVRQAFLDVLCSNVESMQHEKMSADEAEQVMARMEKDGRYKQETW